MPARTKAGFIEPMLLLRIDRLPDGPSRWAYQLKFDGYRAVAFKVGGKVHLRSRNDKGVTADMLGLAGAFWIVAGLTLSLG